MSSLRAGGADSSVRSCCLPTTLAVDRDHGVSPNLGRSRALGNAGRAAPTLGRANWCASTTRVTPGDRKEDGIFAMNRGGRSTALPYVILLIMVPAGRRERRR